MRSERSSFTRLTALLWAENSCRCKDQTPKLASPAARSRKTPTNLSTAFQLATGRIMNDLREFSQGPEAAACQLPISPDCVFDASLVPGTCPGRFLDLKGLINKFLESPDCVFDASLVPGTCPGRFLDLKGLINKFLESAYRRSGVLGRDLPGFPTNRALARKSRQIALRKSQSRPRILIVKFS